MAKENITFRTDTETKTMLDTIADEVDRDRSYIINEAVKSYFEVHEWQVAHIKEGLAQADKGNFASEEEVNKAFKKWRR